MIKADELGNGYIAMKDSKIKLFGTLNLIGRGCVISNKVNDDE